MPIAWDNVLMGVLETAGLLSEAISDRAKLKTEEIPIRIEERKDAAELTRISFNNKEAKKLKRSIKNYLEVVRFAERHNVEVNSEILSGLDLKMKEIEDDIIKSVGYGNATKVKGLLARIRQRRLKK